MLAYILHAWYEGMRSPDKGGLDCYDVKYFQMHMH